MKSILIALIAGGLIGSFVTYKLQKPVIVTETKVEYKDKIVSKTETVVKEIVKPDGTKETVTVIEDNKTEDVALNQSKIEIKNPPQWNVGATVNMSTLSKSLTVGKRIAGPIWGQVGVDINKQLTLGIGIEF